MRRAEWLKVVLVLVLLTFAVISVVPAWCQEVTAHIVGTITDPSGAPIAGATATATDTQRGTVWSAKSNDSGIYNILRIPVGNYSVKISAAGFQTSAYPPFTLALNQTAKVDVQLTNGKATETMEVSAATPLLQTETTEVSTNIDAHTNVTLPLAGRNYLQLALLAPGTTNNNPDGIRNPQNLDNSSRP